MDNISYMCADWAGDDAVFYFNWDDGLVQVDTKQAELNALKFKLNELKEKFMEKYR